MLPISFRVWIADDLRILAGNEECLVNILIISALSSVDLDMKETSVARFFKFRLIYYKSTGYRSLGRVSFLTIVDPSVVLRY